MLALRNRVVILLACRECHAELMVAAYDTGVLDYRSRETWGRNYHATHAHSKKAKNTGYEPAEIFRESEHRGSFAELLSPSRAKWHIRATLIFVSLTEAGSFAGPW